MRLSEVGFTPSLHNMLIGALPERGLVLFCGSTGSGKTDSAKALVAEAASLGREALGTGAENSPEGCVIDADDLRGAPETLRAIELARTCLVVGVVRSGSGPNAVNRLVDMGAEPARLEQMRIWLVTQRLARGLCQACRAPRATTKAEFEAAGLDKKAWYFSGGYVYEAHGCPECKDGHRGLFVLAEGFAKVDSRRASRRGRLLVRRCREPRP